jgi:hypothetical protein
MQMLLDRGALKAAEMDEEDGGPKAPRSAIFA